MTVGSRGCPMACPESLEAKDWIDQRMRLQIASLKFLLVSFAACEWPGPAPAGGPAAVLRQDGGAEPGSQVWLSLRLAHY